LLVVLDEPEAALHRAAEAFLASGLAGLTARGGLTVVVATHSPELLDRPEAFLYQVQRADAERASRLVALDFAAKDALSHLGLLPSDLLRRQRGFLLVEGEHDFWGLDEWIGSDLRRLRVEILPFRGAGNLKSILDSRFLFDYTDAHLFTLLDALKTSIVSSAWRTACKLAKTHGSREAIDHIQSQLKGLPGEEHKILASFLSRAIQDGCTDRLHPLGLTEPDVLDYLPVTGFVTDAASWKELRDKLSSDSRKPPSGTAFKKWLESSQGADLGEASIRRVARGVTVVPADVLDLIDEIRAVLA
jgi:predicted ATP-dependent endonuclease of OLD family